MAALLTPRHPSQLYEALLEGLVLFLILRWLALREHVQGMIDACSSRAALALVLVLSSANRGCARVGAVGDELTALPSVHH